jgi:class 3 adenylate cyclase
MRQGRTSKGAAMEFRILGPLEVVENGQQINLGGAKHRALLAILLLHANEVVSTDRLIDALWEKEAPQTGRKALQVYVSQLRKTLGRDRLETRAPGYRLRVAAGELDLERFEVLAAEGRVQEALALWRGQPLAEFAYQRFAQSEIERLEELRVALLEQRIEEQLEQGKHASLVGELEAIVREHPLRERLRAQLMLALYRSGRQAEALEAFQQARRALVDGLGIDPGRSLRELERAILQQDSDLELDAALSALPEPPVQPRSVPAAEASPREVRKTVTVLFADVAGSTELGERLDPESLRRVLGRYFNEMRAVLERHGATVEKFIGDAVMAVFGVPAVHEDDPVRAVRAALEMREKLATLNDDLERQWGVRLLMRIGLNTGEVVVGGMDTPTYATGDAVNVAARLQQEASAGEILMGVETHRFVRDLVDAQAVGTLAVKGKEAGIEAIRLVSLVQDDTRARRFSSPMVGRQRERRRLDDALDQAIGDRSCQLFTILGAAGVGKSRLVQEFLHDLGPSPLVARGRCLPYGEGITYWPVIEVVRDAAGLGDTSTPDESLSKIATLLEGEQDVELAAKRIGEVIGLSEELGGAEEGFWAVRTFFEALARRRPLVLVFDDIHWGEATFLDLVDHIADWTRDAPILLVCVARPELLDARPHWGGGKLNATSVLLEPLSEAESVQLVDNLADAVGLDVAARRRIVDTAGGNPLFVEEMLALLLENGRPDSVVAVPPTIQALLAARLDRLQSAERAAIEAAAVEGQVFHESSVAELLSADVHDGLQTLVRRELIRPDRPVFSGERAYRFRHLLLRDAAYESIPKEARAALHEHHAAWLERKAGDRALEFEEIFGYHLEQAFRYRAELGPVDEAGRELAAQAGRRLGVAGRRALARGDTPGAINLVSRAAALLGPDDPLRVHIVPGVRIIQGLGDKLGWAEDVLSQAIATGDVGLQTHARVQQGLLWLFTESTVDVDDLVAIAKESIDVFERLGDELGLARAWRLLQQARYLGRQSAASADAAEHALVHARRADDTLEEVEIIDWLGIALFMGATPASQAESRMITHLQDLHGSRSVEAVLLGCLAGLKAMQGQLSEARSLLDRARPVVDDLAYISRLSVVPFHAGIAELLADNPVGAERMLRATLEPLEAVGETSTYSAIVAVLAQAVYRQGRYEECEALTRVSEDACHLNDVFAQVTWRPTRAKALARRGRYAEAETLAQEAIDFATASDFLNAHGSALIDLAEVLELAGRPHEALRHVEQAIKLFEQKGNVVSEAKAARALDELRNATGVKTRGRA